MTGFRKPAKKGKDPRVRGGWGAGPVRAGMENPVRGEACHLSEAPVKWTDEEGRRTLMLMIFRGGF